MYALILFFNKEQTDFIIYGPYVTIADAENAHEKLRKLYKGITQSFWVEMKK